MGVEGDDIKISKVYSIWSNEKISECDFSFGFLLLRRHLFPLRFQRDFVDESWHRVVERSACRQAAELRDIHDDGGESYENGHASQSSGNHREDGANEGEPIEGVAHVVGDGLFHVDARVVHGSDKQRDDMEEVKGCEEEGVEHEEEGEDSKRTARRTGSDQRHDGQCRE